MGVTSVTEQGARTRILETSKAPNKRWRSTTAITKDDDDDRMKWCEPAARAFIHPSISINTQQQKTKVIFSLPSSLDDEEARKEGRKEGGCVVFRAAAAAADSRDTDCCCKRKKEKKEKRGQERWCRNDNSITDHSARPSSSRRPSPLWGGIAAGVDTRLKKLLRRRLTFISSSSTSSSALWCHFIVKIL